MLSLPHYQRTKLTRKMGLLRATVIVRDDGAVETVSSAKQAQVFNTNDITRIVPAVCGPQSAYATVNSQIVYKEGFGTVSYYASETAAALHEEAAS